MKNQPIPNAINSQEKSSYWILVGVGLLFILIVTPALINIPAEIRKGNDAILFVLLFPLAGLGMMFGGWKTQNSSKRYDKSNDYCRDKLIDKRPDTSLGTPKMSKLASNFISHSQPFTSTWRCNSLEKPICKARMSFLI